MGSTEGQRLLAFMHARAPRSEGGLDGVALRHGLRRQTVYDWAAGTRHPNLATLRPWAEALGVSRAELVAAMDATPDDALSGMTEAALAALAGEIGSEVAAALVKRLPPPNDAKPPAAGQTHGRGKGP